MAAGCDRLLDPAVAGGERARQRRFLSLMIAGPFALLAAWPAAFSAHLSLDVSAAALAVAFCLAWGLAGLVALRGRSEPAMQAALAGGAAVLATAAAGAGGLTSPAALILLAPIFEAWWVQRSRSALVWGGAATLAATLAPIAIPFLGGAGAATFPLWHWLVPAAYAALAAPRMARALREEIEALRPQPERALEDAIDAVVLRLAPGGDTVEASGRVREIIGVPPAMLLGEGFFERIHVGDRVTLLRAIDTGEPSTFDLRVRIAGERAGTYATFAAELCAGEPMFLVLRDNTMVDALQEELATAQDLAASSDIAKARFLAAVSHELRTPLNAIIGFSDMLAYEMVGKFSDPRQKEYAALIRDSGNHLLGVVNSILDVSKIESGAYPIQPEPFVFAEAASVCHQMLSVQAAAKSVELHNRVTPAAGEILADRRAVQQVLINLLSNAVKFTPAGGSVTLDATRRGRTLTFRVSDTGIGIAEEDLARLGRPFVQVQNDYTRQYDGAGLGLSIAKGLVALHGGTMSIQSTPGAGTVVAVTLPLQSGASAAAPEPVPQTEEFEGEAHASFRKSA